MIDLEGHRITTRILHHLVSRAEDKHPNEELDVIGLTWSPKLGYVLWYNTQDNSTHCSTWKDDK